MVCFQWGWFFRERRWVHMSPGRSGHNDWGNTQGNPPNSNVRERKEQNWRDGGTIYSLYAWQQIIHIFLPSTRFSQILTISSRRSGVPPLFWRRKDAGCVFYGSVPPLGAIGQEAASTNSPDQPGIRWKASGPPAISAGSIRLSNQTPSSSINSRISAVVINGLPCRFSRGIPCGPSLMRASYSDVPAPSISRRSACSTRPLRVVCLRIFAASLFVKGTGRMAVSLYAYDAAGVYLETLPSKSLNVDFADWEQIYFEQVVPATVYPPKKDRHGGQARGGRASNRLCRYALLVFGTAAG